MLSRAINRSLYAPGRLPPTSLQIASTTQFIRCYAKDNKSKNAQKKPTSYSKPPGASASSKQPLSAAFGAASSIPKSSSKPEYSNKQDEVSAAASPERNTVQESVGGGSGKPSDSGRPGEDPSFSGNQEEFKTNSSPADNTAPQSSSPSAIDPAEAQQQFKLPDLTQGIPSTIEYELSGRTPKQESTGLNITEDAGQESSSSGGGRGRGELPDSAYVSSTEKRRAKMANLMYLAFAGFVVIGGVYFGRNWETEEEEAKHPEAPSGWSLGAMYNRAKARSGDQLGYYTEPAFQKLLPDPDPMFERPYTLVLSLEDLLIHSEWSREHGWRMAKRPGVDYFLRYLSQYYEIVVFTSVPFGIAEPVIRKLDPYHIITFPLFREATNYQNGEYVKDLAYLNRDLSKVIMIDTVAHHAKNQPENAIILPKWTGDPQDKTLVSLIPFLEYIPIMATPDVRKAIKSFEGTHIPTEFAKREAVARKKFNEQMSEELKKKPRSGLSFLGGALGMKPQTMDGEQSIGEGMAQGKMLQDLARERGQREYQRLEKMIREEGAKWLAEEAANEEKMKEEAMKGMKNSFTGLFGGGAQN